MEFATYQTTPEENGNGTYFYTDCGHWLYSIRGKMPIMDVCATVVFIMENTLHRVIVIS